MVLTGGIKVWHQLVGRWRAPSNYSKELNEIIADMLIKDPLKRPSMRKILEKEILCNSMVSIGKKYGVSDNAIRKWCQSYNIDI